MFPRLEFASSIKAQELRMSATFSRVTIALLTCKTANVLQGE